MKFVTQELDEILESLRALTVDWKDDQALRVRWLSFLIIDISLKFAL